MNGQRASKSLHISWSWIKRDCRVCDKLKFKNMLHFQNEMSSSDCRFKWWGHAGANASGLVSFPLIWVQTLSTYPFFERMLFHRYPTVAYNQSMYTNGQHLNPLAGELNIIDHFLIYNYLSEKPGSWWTFFDTYHPSKHCCRPITPSLSSGFNWWQWPS